MQPASILIAQFTHEKCNFSDVSDKKKKKIVPWWRTGIRWLDPAGPPLLGYLHFSFLESQFWKLNVFFRLTATNFFGLKWSLVSFVSCDAVLLTTEYHKILYIRQPCTCTLYSTLKLGFFSILKFTIFLPFILPLRNIIEINSFLRFLGFIAALYAFTPSSSHT
jgi:hypothetical protein